MPNDIKREFLTGPSKYGEIMEKLEIIINEMMADDGPVPMDRFGHEQRHVMRRRVCGRLERVQISGKGTGKKGPNGQGVWHRGKGADEWTSSKRGLQGQQT